MGQKPIVDDEWEVIDTPKSGGNDDWEVISEPTPSFNPNAKPARSLPGDDVVSNEPSILSKAYHYLSDPLTDAPSRFMKGASKVMDDVYNKTTIQSNGQGGLKDYLSGVDARAKGFFQGAGEGLGDLASGMSSPANIIMALASGGSSAAVKAGLSETSSMAPAALKTIAKALSNTGKAAAIPGIIHGGEAVSNPDSTWGEVGTGLTELAGNVAGLNHNPFAKTHLPGTIPENIAHDAGIPPEQAGLTMPEGPIPQGIIPPEAAPDIMNSVHDSQFGIAPTESPRAQPHIGELTAPPPHEGLPEFGREPDVPHETFDPETGEMFEPPVDDSDVPHHQFGQDVIDSPNVDIMEGEVPSEIMNPFGPTRVGREAQNLIDQGHEILNRPRGEPETPTSYHEPDVLSISPRLKARFYELTDKATDGSITDAELVEAKQLNKIYRGFADESSYIPPIETEHMGGDVEAPPPINELPPAPEFGADIDPPTMGEDFFNQVKPEIPEMPAPLSFADRLRNTFSDETGSVPREPVEPPKPTLATSPIGKTVVVTREGLQANAAIATELAKHGFEFEGISHDGKLKFKKTRPSVESPPILESDVEGAHPTPTGRASTLGPVTDRVNASPVSEAFNLSRGMLASGDLSGPFRQGLALIHKKAFWTSLKPMIKSWATEDGFRASQEAIAARPLFRKRAGPDGKVYKSFAEEAGLKLTDLTDKLSNREEALMSTWSESGIPLGEIFKEGGYLPSEMGRKVGKGIQDIYGKTAGEHVVRRSNRAYTGFLNNLRADVFESLVKDGEVFGADAKVNLPLARELADFVNIASGRGSLGRLEKAAPILNATLFAPRLIAARLQLMSPKHYIMASPQVRRETVKSLLAIAAAGNTVTTLAKMAGAEVSLDPTSSDFGKPKFGNTRIDPYGGFQQYIVAASKLLAGKVTSSTNPENVTDLWNDDPGPYDDTHGSVAGRFARGKLHPVLGFATSILMGRKEMGGDPMNFTSMNPMENAVAQRFIPILMQDMYELAMNDEISPELKALVISLSGLGMGSQTYGGPKQDN